MNEPSGSPSVGDNLVDKSSAQELDAIDPSKAIGVAQAEAARQIIRLRAKYADWLLRLLGLQIFAADALFFWYGIAAGWANIQAKVVTAWLAAVVVQVVTLVLAITKFLFSKEALIFLPSEAPAGDSSSRIRNAWKALRRKPQPPKNPVPNDELDPKT